MGYGVVVFRSAFMMTKKGEDEKVILCELFFGEMTHRLSISPSSRMRVTSSGLLQDSPGLFLFSTNALSRN